MLELINKIKEPAKTEELISYFISKLTVHENHQYQQLQKFFTSTLSDDPMERSSSWAEYILMLNEILDTK